ncbi:hypothetical protein PTNB73_01570 [Pyrenophora teres f. teres]|uniref:Essential protein Yae1 N-terminal domain-containing protein n=1 Tax=Pyrenophora teres f. teres (strain 0-1) TaxID=861557 RepID=E3RDL9_PYRTT|nr:hypothetical protein PTT_02501 [Pyrenophora teres f. teres 0-1]KAE8845588.1 hypothetical protein HRS9139_00155 [Pyrenophora teres f. teres]KAE8847726.1 hypothetical protein PTNB85_01569 [Pyrenophora teres f. teres]KAE8854118.1 hypothetical protein HRS9122_01110 [Pyrenophora teres f. teres]KAE8867653.1 hypothetical protein PTNB29_01564 [Pyrenophora teres f. teres]
MEQTTVPDRLQVLLTTVREATLTEPDRMPLKAFLASLQHEATESTQEASQNAQVVICETFLISLVSDTAQNFPTAASCAVQTDSATISLWDMVPRAREEGYERGFHEGINAGHKSGIEEGKSMKMSEALSIAFEQGETEGFKMAQEQHRVEQHRVFEQERNIERAKQSAYEARVLQDQRGVDEATENMDQDWVGKYGVDNKVTSNGAKTRQLPSISTAVVDEEVAPNGEKTWQSQIVSTAVVDNKSVSNGKTVKQPPTVSTVVPSKEKLKPTSNGTDPFAVLLPLMRQK